MPEVDAANIIQLSPTVRIEPGPARKTGKATVDLLSNSKTAEHYQLGAADADGRKIVANQPMTYLDWLGERVWYVYQLEDVSGDDTTTESERYVEVGVFPTQDEAEAAAAKLR